MDSSTNAILHPWLKKELEAILNRCPPAPEEVREGCRWQDWDCYPSADQLDRWFPPIRVLLILDNLMGHRSRDFTQWCAEHGVCLLYTPNAGSWLNMAESVQRIIVRRALEGYHIYDVEILKDWLRDAIAGWNRHPTHPVHLGGQTSCTARSGLRASSSSGRIRSHHSVRSAKAGSLGALLQACHNHRWAWQVTH